MGPVAALKKPKQKTITFPIAFVDGLLSAMRRRDACAPSTWRDVLAVDIGARTGWAWAKDGKIFSGEGAPDECARHIRALSTQDAGPVLFVREAPFTGTNASMGRSSINAHGLFRLGFSAGAVTAHLAPLIHASVLWEPLPVSWRAVLGLNRRAADHNATRAVVEQEVIAWSEKAAGRKLETQQGRKKADEANAIAMAMAGIAIMQSIRDSDQAFARTIAACDS